MLIWSKLAEVAQANDLTKVVNLKIVVFIFIATFLSGCVSTSPEQKQQAKEYEERSKAARERAAAHGELPGTPDNMDGIRKAEDQAVSYHLASKRAEETWIDKLILSLLNTKKHKK